MFISSVLRSSYVVLQHPLAPASLGQGTVPHSLLPRLRRVVARLFVLCWQLLRLEFAPSHNKETAPFPICCLFPSIPALSFASSRLLFLSALSLFFTVHPPILSLSLLFCFPLTFKTSPSSSTSRSPRRHLSTTITTPFVPRACLTTAAQPAAPWSLLLQPAPLLWPVLLPSRSLSLSLSLFVRLLCLVSRLSSLV